MATFPLRSKMKHPAIVIVVFLMMLAPEFGRHASCQAQSQTDASTDPPPYPVTDAEISPAEASRRAERLLSDGDTQGALAIYAAKDPSRLTETDRYNRGVAFSQNGQFEEAADSLRQAASAGDTTIAARARYNLGNAQYALAVKTLEEDGSKAEEAINHLRSAIADYRSALRVSSNDDDARFNIELAAKLIQKIKQDQQQQDQQQQDQQQQDQQQQDQQQQDQQQQDQQQQDQQQQDQQQQDQQQQDQQQQDQQQQDQQQQDQQQQDQQQQDQQQQDQQQQDQQQQDQQQQDQQQQGDSQSDQQSEESDSEESSRDQRSPRQPSDRDAENQDREESPPSPDDASESEQPEVSDGELTAENSLPETQASASAEQMEKADGAFRMTKEEARKLLQSIRDRDLQRRLQRRAADRARRVPVEKDW